MPRKVIGGLIQCATPVTDPSLPVEKIRDGLWRWTAPHPDWEPGGGWEKDVGCVYYEGPDAVVLIDPLVPAGSENVNRELSKLLVYLESPTIVANPVALSILARSSKFGSIQPNNVPSGVKVRPAAGDRSPSGGTKSPTSVP